MFFFFMKLQKQNSMFHQPYFNKKISFVISIGTGLDMNNENKTLSKFEIMDGAPVKGEAIPVRLFLGGFDLTPTYKDVANKFSVSYILNLVLVDEDDRRYFKQKEIILWRRQDRAKQTAEKEQQEANEKNFAALQ